MKGLRDLDHKKVLAKQYKTIPPPAHNTAFSTVNPSPAVNQPLALTQMQCALVEEANVSLSGSLYNRWVKAIARAEEDKDSGSNGNGRKGNHDADGKGVTGALCKKLLINLEKAHKQGGSFRHAQNLCSRCQEGTDRHQIKSGVQLKHEFDLHAMDVPRHVTDRMYSTIGNAVSSTLLRKHSRSMRGHPYGQRDDNHKYTSEEWEEWNKKNKNNNPSNNKNNNNNNNDNDNNDGSKVWPQ